MSFNKLEDVLSDPDNVQQIEDFAALNYSPRKIARYFNIHATSFLSEWKKPNSNLRRAYDRGILSVQAEIDSKVLNAAKEGKVTAIQIWEKTMRKNKIEAVREALLNGSIWA